jgi:hypothetical protein
MAAAVIKIRVHILQPSFEAVNRGETRIAQNLAWQRHSRPSIGAAGQKTSSE